MKSPSRLLLASSLALGLASFSHASDKPGERDFSRGAPSGCATLSVAGADWDICDNFITSNGLPAGGGTTTGSPGSGASVVDANIDEQGDAFDGGAMFWINGSQVGGVATYTATSAQFAAQSIAGLNTQLRYDALSSRQALRAYLSLSNPGSSAITVTVDYATNFGADGDTTIESTQSGDTSFTTSDAWVVTSDTGPFDPVNTTVLFSGSPAVTPSSVSTTVFGSAGTQGVRATYPVTVPAGGTVALVTFQAIDPTIAGAVAAAAEFNAIAAGSPLLSGLSSAQLAAIQNIGAGVPVPPGAPRPAVVPVGGYSSVILAFLLAVAGAFALSGMRRH